eukprot:TRINITY_DN2887_c0_g1_i2.p1 TRINITY_DN2887_c0_g1~~TRINITY_DN2887_c0_g1_i2.p1  ORF type:complete len:338 (-),score=53.24 TRINITY_DN2887_c0_g1_i2:23-1036(-)
MRGADLFAPGVLGGSRWIRAGDKVAVYVDVDETMLKGATPAMLTGRRHFVGNGVAQMDRIAMIAKDASGIAVKMTEPIHPAPALNGVLPDMLLLQNLPSMLVAHLLSPLPSDRVLDMCASPGGKTTHAAALMHNQGIVVAVDRTADKVKAIEDLASRLGLTNIQAIRCDSTTLLTPTATSTPSAAPFEPESFDRIMLDPPCSGLGQRPRLKDLITLKNLIGFSPYQRKLFHVAFRLLKVGGTLVYSTCTLNPLENEAIVRFALDTFGLQLVDPGALRLGGPGLRWSEDGMPDGTRLPKGLTDQERLLVQRFDPAQSDTIGFFVAKFIKISADVRSAQ